MFGAEGLEPNRGTVVASKAPFPFFLCSGEPMSTFLKSAFALALVVPCTVSSQVLGGRVTASGGMDAVIFDGSKYVPGYVAQIGLDWPVGQRGAFRLGLMHYQQNRTDNREFMGGCSAQCVESRNYGLTGLTFDGTFDLTKGRFRPYVLSGVGLYRTGMTTTNNFSCMYDGFITSTCSYTGNEQSFRSSGWTAGLHSGLGLSMPFRKVTLFTEGRIAIVGATQQMMGDGSVRALIPITFGAKF